MESIYSTQQKSDVLQLYAAVQSNPPDKQTIIKVMAEAFINGMKAQYRLTATGGPAGTVSR